MRIYRFLVVGISLLMLADSSAYSLAKVKSYPGKLTLRHMQCFKTTEAGEDEVYFIVLVKRVSDGKILAAERVRGGQKDDGCQPGCVGHWNMNDRGSGSNRQIENVEFWSGKVSLGDSVDITVLIMEEDGGLPQPYMDLVAKEAEKSGNAYAVAAAQALKAISAIFTLAHVSDSDDFIGGFTARLSCYRQQSNGKVRVTWTTDPKKGRWPTMRYNSDPAEYQRNEPDSDLGKARRLSFTGDDSIYNLAVE